MNKKILFGLTAIFILGLTIGLSVNLILQHADPKVNVYMTVTKGESSGAVATLSSGNLITDLGEMYIRDNVASDGVTFTNETIATWSISLSNVGSPLAAWTELDTEVAANGFSRAAGTVAGWSYSGDKAFNVTKTFTASGSQQLQTAGLQWDDTGESDNNLFAAATFTQTTFENSDTLTITWIIVINAN